MEKRKWIHFGGDAYTGRRRYFVTICCAQRRRLFASSQAAKWIETQLLGAASRYRFRLHAWCVMPDHVHFLVEGSADGCDLMAFVRRFKQRTSLGWRTRAAQTLWQRNFYEHILRRPEELSSIAAYIWSNPVRQGICDDPRRYPHSGSETFDWKKLVSAESTWRPPWVED